MIFIASLLIGILCGQCADGYAVTMDLLQCVVTDTNCAIGLSVFLTLCGIVAIICLLVLIFNVELPNEMKGFVFYAQVRSSDITAKTI